MVPQKLMFLSSCGSNVPWKSQSLLYTVIKWAKGQLKRHLCLQRKLNSEVTHLCSHTTGGTQMRGGCDMKFSYKPHEMMTMLGSSLTTLSLLSVQSSWAEAALRSWTHGEGLTRPQSQSPLTEEFSDLAWVSPLPASLSAIFITAFIMIQACVSVSEFQWSLCYIWGTFSVSSVSISF